jgi:sensor domain CHASE-containing protein
MPTIRSITREAARNDYKVSSFVLGVVQSPAFLSARAAVTEQAGQN